MVVFPYLSGFQNNTRNDTKKRYMFATFLAVEKLSPTPGSDWCMVRRKGEKQAAHASSAGLHNNQIPNLPGSKNPTLISTSPKISLKPQEHRGPTIKNDTPTPMTLCYIRGFRRRSCPSRKMPLSQRRFPQHGTPPGTICSILGRHWSDFASRSL